jgi:hypothetical protein
VKLDRNVKQDGAGKYALLKLRALDGCRMKGGSLPSRITQALETLQNAGILDWGAHGTESEFFVIRLKDKFAQGALCAYATACEHDGEWEFGREVRELAGRAGPNSPFCKRPD